MAENACPLWIGYVLASPVRKLSHNPAKILSPYIEEGMKVLDIGCAMGFFSLPLARMVGPQGRVICVDMQEKMIEVLKGRARKSGLSERIVTRICAANSLGLDDLKGKIDFALAFAVVHEVPDAQSFFLEIYQTMKSKTKLLVAEPRGRVSQEDFETTVAAAERAGFAGVDSPRIRRSRVMLFEKRAL